MILRSPGLVRSLRPSSRGGGPAWHLRMSRRLGLTRTCQCPLRLLASAKSRSGFRQNEAGSDFAGLGGFICRGRALLGCNLGTVQTCGGDSDQHERRGGYYNAAASLAKALLQSRFKWGPRLTWTLLRLEPLDSESP